MYPHGSGRLNRPDRAMRHHCIFMSSMASSLCMPLEVLEGMYDYQSTKGNGNPRKNDGAERTLFIP